MVQGLRSPVPAAAGHKTTPAAAEGVVWRRIKLGIGTGWLGAAAGASGSSFVPSLDPTGNLRSARFTLAKYLVWI